MGETVEKKRAVGNGVKRAVFAALGILIQLLWLYMLLFRLGQKYQWLGGLTNVAAILLVLGIYAKNETASMKMPWLILITAFPFLGVFLYLTIGLNGGLGYMKKHYENLDTQLLTLLKQDPGDLEALEKLDAGAATQSHYLNTYAGYPVYHHTDVTFYDDGAAGYAAQLEDLAKAEKFIFMEYHAIEDSTSFAPLHEILKQKAKEGVEVRIFYDYVGSMGFVGNKFAKMLDEEGIQCRVFNPVAPVFNLFLNNRDHRKITVIDGKVGFTGGYNLADEYFHVTEPYGHWLDTGIRLEGDAVRSLTVTFFENWNGMSNKKGEARDTDFDRYLPEVSYRAKQNGFIQPYADTPLDDEHVGENVYINVLRNAKKYAWFITPYLIITDEMKNAFVMAAKSGVDVRIITPGIPDKKMIYSLTRSYYAGLVQNGVRIYEYTPGFCHAKQCVSDDFTATCGTINLDYRSLYHHFENGTLMFDYPAVMDIKKQFEETFPKCNEVTEEYRTGRSSVLRLKQMLLRLIAPLM